MSNSVARELRKRFTEETGESLRSSEPGFFPNGRFNDDYVEWLEEENVVIPKEVFRSWVESFETVVNFAGKHRVLGGTRRNGRTLRETD